MSFFDKVKSLKNAITGGAAEVELYCEQVLLGEPFTVHVRVTVGEASIQANKVYLKVHGQEFVRIDTVARDEDGHEVSKPMECTAHTVRLELDVEPAQELEANQAYEWEVEVTLPEDAPPIYHGCHCKHVYRAMAGIDCFGNDPDSGWVEL